MSKMPDEKKYKEITIGVEFETGRIIDGKVEYGKILNLGVVPDATQKVYSTGISLAELERYTFIHGYTSSTWPVEMVPQKIDDNSIVLTIAGANIKITTYVSNYAEANYINFVELHYLKNS